MRLLIDYLCFECSGIAEHQHHVVPRVRGGTMTIPLCTPCHAKIHGVTLSHPNLIREGLKAAKDRGQKLGRPRERPDAEIRRLRDSGLSYRQIEKDLKISKGKVCRGLSKGSVQNSLKSFSTTAIQRSLKGGLW